MSVNDFTVQEIIQQFEEQCDDATELSTDQELALFNRILGKIYDDRPWEFLKREATGTLSTSVPYVSLPTGFGYVLQNIQSSDNSIGADFNGAQKVIYTTSAYNPTYKLVNWSDRRTYYNNSGYAWIDMVNSRLYFSTTPTTTDSYSFDYKFVPTELLITDVGTAILLPQRFRPMIRHAMAIDDDMLLRFPKERSYAAENNAKYQSYMQDLTSWNARLALNN